MTFKVEKIVYPENTPKYMKHKCDHHLKGELYSCATRDGDRCLVSGSYKIGDKYYCRQHAAKQCVKYSLLDKQSSLRMKVHHKITYADSLALKRGEKTCCHNLTQSYYKEQNGSPCGLSASFKINGDYYCGKHSQLTALNHFTNMKSSV